MTSASDPNTPIDVLIPTYNSADFLDAALESIRQCIPVSRIIAADHHSEDGTVAILHKHGAEIHYENRSLGYARQLLISLAKTKVFMMLDADVVLSDRDWYPRALRLLGSEVQEGRQIGAVAMIPSDRPPMSLKKYVEFWWKLIPALERDFFVTHSTLFLKNAVEGIRIPESLGAAEDVCIWLHLRRNGYVSRTMRVNGIHHFSYSESKGSWMGANLRILESYRGSEVLPFIIRNVCLYPVLFTIAAIFTKDPHVLTYNSRRWYSYLKGYSSPSKFWQIARTAAKAGKSNTQRS